MVISTELTQDERDGYARECIALASALAKLAESLYAGNDDQAMLYFTLIEHRGELLEDLPIVFADAAIDALNRRGRSSLAIPA